VQKDWIGTSKGTFQAIGTHGIKEREQHDFYATQPIAIDGLLSIETFNRNIWECACGEGHLSKRLEEKGYTVMSSDLVNRGYGEQFDFMERLRPWDGDIITNPPYYHAQQFVTRAIENVKFYPDAKVAMLLRLLFLEGQERGRWYKTNPPAVVGVFSKRITCAMNGNFEGLTGTIAFAWFIWKKHEGDTIVKWI
jgi:hypothetical protein